MLSVIAQGYFAGSPVMLLPVAALCVFVAVFTAVCWRTWRRASDAELARLARLPIEEEGTRHG
jgi:hypothetical protein